VDGTLHGHTRDSGDQQSVLDFSSKVKVSLMVLQDVGSPECHSASSCLWADLLVTGRKIIKKNTGTLWHYIAKDAIFGRYVMT